MIEILKKINVVILRFYALLFFVAIIAIVAEIVARYLGKATTFSVEFSGYVMASLVAWASAYALLSKSHIRIDFLYIARSDRCKNLLDLLSILLFFLVAVFLAWSASRIVLDSIEFEAVSNTTLRVPLWIPQLSWCLGFIWLAFCSGILLVKALICWLMSDRSAMAESLGTDGDSPL